LSFLTRLVFHASPRTFWAVKKPVFTVSRIARSEAFRTPRRKVGGGLRPCIPQVLHRLCLPASRLGKPGESLVGRLRRVKRLRASRFFRSCLARLFAFTISCQHQRRPHLISAKSAPDHLVAHPLCSLFVRAEALYAPALVFLGQVDFNHPT